MKIQFINPDIKSLATPKPGDATGMSAASDSNDFFDLVAGMSSGPALQLQKEQVAIDLDLQTDIETEDQQENQLDMQLQQQIAFNPNFAFDKFLLNKTEGEKSAELPADVVMSSPTNSETTNTATDAATTNGVTMAASGAAFSVVQPNKQEISAQQNQRFDNTQLADVNIDDFAKPDVVAAMPVLANDENHQHENNDKSSKEDDLFKAAFNLATITDKTAPTSNLATFTPINAATDSVNNQGDQQDKYVDALKQLGELINSHTSQLAKNEQSFLRESNAPSYSKVAQSAVYPETEIKLEVLPGGMNGLMKETYNANIKVFPPELGGVVVKLKLEKNNAELLIVTESNHIKEIIQTNLAQLRENFHQQEINLTNINVEVQQQQTDGKDLSQQSQNRQPQVQPDRAMPFAETLEPAQKPSQRNLNSLVDTYV